MSRNAFVTSSQSENKLNKLGFFWQAATASSKYVLQRGFIRGVVVQTMPNGQGFHFWVMARLATCLCSSVRFEFSFAFNWKQNLAGKNCGSRDFFTDRYCRAFCCSNACDLETAVTEKILVFFLLIELFLNEI